MQALPNRDAENAAYNLARTARQTVYLAYCAVEKVRDLNPDDADVLAAYTSLQAAHASASRAETAASNALWATEWLVKA
jgi:hypothetical protein